MSRAVILLITESFVLLMVCSKNLHAQLLLNLFVDKEKN